LSRRRGGTKPILRPSLSACQSISVESIPASAQAARIAFSNTTQPTPRSVSRMAERIPDSDEAEGFSIDF